MKFRNAINLMGIVFLLGCGSAFGQTINKPSIQITLRTHQQYYRNGQEAQETWSWTPRIAYRVVGPIAAGSQLAVEFTLPAGKPWIKFGCTTNNTQDDYCTPTKSAMNSNDVNDQESSINTGLAASTITLKSELEATNK